MSNSQIPAWDSQNRPSRPGGHRTPCFQPIRPSVHSPHEEAVIRAGYPWVQTNSLIPTWMPLFVDPRDKPVPDRLNWHSHHGKNTHLIVEGDLSLQKANKFFPVTLSTDRKSPKELTIAPDEVYFGTTQQGCKFVEGHQCLSPRSAHRYMSRGSVEWVDKAGRAVQGADRAYVLQQLDNAKFETKLDFTLKRKMTSCSFEDDNQVTRSMREWFWREWNDPNVRTLKGIIGPVSHPLGSS